jgi:hypothetical protein
MTRFGLIGRVLSPKMVGLILIGTSLIWAAAVWLAPAPPPSKTDAFADRKGVVGQILAPLTPKSLSKAEALASDLGLGDFHVLPPSLQGRIAAAVTERRARFAQDDPEAEWRVEIEKYSAAMVSNFNAATSPEAPKKGRDLDVFAD